MKLRYFVHSFLLLGILTLLTACPDNAGDSVDESFIQFEVDGKRYTARAVGVLSPSDGKFLLNMFTPVFNSGGNQYVEMEFGIENTQILTGTFALNTTNLLYLAIRPNKDASYTEYDSRLCDNVSGQIVVSEQDNNQRTVSGTFNGTLCDEDGTPKNITGTFSAVRFVLQ
jgi:hypothetical protein